MQKENPHPALIYSEETPWLCPPSRVQFIKFKPEFISWGNQEQKRKKLSKIDRKAHRLVQRMKDSLKSQRDMNMHIELFDEPPGNENAYFEKKMQNFYEAQRMENRVNNYEIDHIINKGIINSNKKKNMRRFSQSVMN